MISDILWTLVGAFALGRGLWKLLQYLYALTYWTSATGKVIGYKTVGSKSYFPMISFTYHDGTEHKFEADISIFSFLFKAEDEVIVLYSLADRGRSAIVNSPLIMFENLVMMSLGCYFLLPILERFHIVNLW